MIYDGSGSCDLNVLQAVMMCLENTLAMLPARPLTLSLLLMLMSKGITRVVLSSLSQNILAPPVASFAQLSWTNVDEDDIIVRSNVLDHSVDRVHHLNPDEVDPVQPRDGLVQLGLVDLPSPRHDEALNGEGKVGEGPISGGDGLPAHRGESTELLHFLPELLS